jgi:serine/threonine protein kinase
MADSAASSESIPEPRGTSRIPDVDTLVAGALPNEAAARQVETLAFFMGQPPSAHSETPPTAGVAGQAEPMPEAPFFHKFELLEQRGGGGMGIVFKARDTKLNRIVALKTLRNTILPNTDELERFYREARAISQLVHPHIVPLLEFGEFRGTPYYVMHLAEGGTLSAWRKARQPPERVATVIEKIALAVDYAHRHGVIHRDIKPGNVLLTADGEPMLADFGLAYVNDSSQRLTPTDFLLGTPNYMAPEQLRGSKVDARADIWSLGIVLYELLTGELPFDDEDRAALFVKIATHEPARMRAPNRPVDRGLESIVFRCLEKQPADRYQTAADLAADLAAWRRGEWRSQSWYDWANRWARSVSRHPVRAAGAMLSLGLAIVLTPLVINSLDEHAPIRSEISALERGEAVTLIGPVGGPKWYRSFPPNELILKMSRIGQPLEIIDAKYPCFMELLPGPLPSRYRLQCEIPRWSNSGRKLEEERGLIVCAVLQESQHRRQWTGIGVTLVFPDENNPRQVRAMMELRHIELAKNDQRINQAIFAFKDKQCEIVLNEQPRDREDHGWFHLVFEVSPEAVIASLDGHQIGRLDPAEELRAASLLQRKKGLDGQPLNLILDRRGSLGLWLRHTDTRVRNVIVTPLE